MLFSNIRSWFSGFQSDPLGTLINLVFFAAALLLSLILHEISHGYVALKCGDPTAKMMGRLTLDPRKHLDPIGALCMVLLRIGWAKPVPINPYNFRHRNRDMILVSVAGICMNLILFTVSCFLYALIYVQMIKGNISGGWTGYPLTFLLYMISFNISLAVFNLLPVPPLDGYRLVNQIFFRGRLDLDPRMMQMINYGFLIVCLSGVLSTAFSRVCSFFMNGALDFFFRILY